MPEKFDTNIANKRSIISTLKWVIPLALILIPNQLFSEPQNDKIAEDIYNKVIVQKHEELPPFPIGNPNPPIVKPVIKQVYKPVVKYESGVVQQSIIKWADFYGVSSDTMLRVAKCESGFRPDAVNGQYSGLFQFSPRTFNANVGYMTKRGITVNNASVWDYDSSAQVAAWMFSIGQSKQWECK